MKRNLIYLSFLALMLVYGQSVTAQRKCCVVRCDSVQNIENRAMAMSRKLMLDEKTSAKFMPLYTAYLTELSQCQPCQPQKYTTDEKCLQNIEQRYDEQIKRLNIKKSYVAKFADILTPLQVQKVMSPNCRKAKGCMPKGVKKPMRGMQRPDCPLQQQNCPLKQ